MKLLSNEQKSILRGRGLVGGMTKKQREAELRKEHERARQVSALTALYAQDQYRDFVAEKDEEMRQRIAASQTFKDVKVKMYVYKQCPFGSSGPDGRIISAHREIDGLKVHYGVICSTSETGVRDKLCLRVDSLTTIPLPSDIASLMGEVIDQSRESKRYLRWLISNWIKTKSKQHTLDYLGPRAEVPSFEVGRDETVKKPLKGNTEAIWLRSPTEYDISSEMMEMELKRIDRLAQGLVKHLKVSLRTITNETWQLVRRDREEVKEAARREKAAELARKKEERAEQRRMEKAERAELRKKIRDNYRYTKPEIVQLLNVDNRIHGIDDEGTLYEFLVGAKQWTKIH